jgi:hypothetical protein
MTKRGDRRDKGRGKQIQSLHAQGNVKADEVQKPAVAEPQPASPPAERVAPKVESHDALLAKYTKSLRNWTVCLVVVGFLTTLVLILQWRSFEKADETSRAGLRPYVSGVGLNADTERFPLYWDLSAVIENSGGTPPRELRYVIRSSPDFPLDPEEVFQHPSETDAFFDRSVAPKGQITVRAGAPLANFFTSRRPWYISGGIHYRDQFEGSEEHISKFCFGVVSVKDPRGTSTSIPGYDACTYWNCIDEKACASDRARYDKEVQAGRIRLTKKSSDAPEIPIGTGLPWQGGMVIKALP